MPTPIRDGLPADPLAEGKTVTLSDAILVIRTDAPSDEKESARQFLQMLGEAYKFIELAQTKHRD